MRIAVTCENGFVFQHFGHTEMFKIYEVENNKIVSSKIVDTQGNGHGALATFLQSQQVDILICGGIGEGAKNALSKAGIQLYGGVQGNADEAVQLFLENKLEYQVDVQCQHHEHNEDHACGHHSCESHLCNHSE